MTIKSADQFPVYHGRWPLQNFICALFHDADLAQMTRTSEQDKILVIPSKPDHLKGPDVRKIFDYCLARLQADRPWAGGVPADNGSWRKREAYGKDMHWPVQNLFNLYVQGADVAAALVHGTDKEKAELFEHFGVRGVDRELFLGATNLTQNAKRIFDRALDEFSTETPQNIW
jgi:hypothetical protein